MFLSLKLVELFLSRIILGMTGFFGLLPDEIIIYMALFLPLPSVLKFSLTNIRHNLLICNNEDFWRQIFIQHHGDVIWSGSWKKLYQYGLLSNTTSNEDRIVRINWETKTMTVTLNLVIQSNFDG